MRCDVPSLTKWRSTPVVTDPRCPHGLNDPHTCPYLVDVEDDDTTLCFCCAKCEDICLDTYDN